jgi:hypothetical protein
LSGCNVSFGTDFAGNDFALIAKITLEQCKWRWPSTAYVRPAVADRPRHLFFSDPRLSFIRCFEPAEKSVTPYYHGLKAPAPVVWTLQVPTNAVCALAALTSPTMK